MNTRRCPTCDTELPPESPSGCCPKCLFGLAMAASSPPGVGEASMPPRVHRPFAGYDLKRQLGCGGMGVVYEAVERRLNRVVALKL